MGGIVGLVLTETWVKAIELRPVDRPALIEASGLLWPLLLVAAVVRAVVVLWRMARPARAAGLPVARVVERDAAKR